MIPKTQLSSKIMLSIICTHTHVIRHEICLTLPLTMKLGELQKVQCKCDFELLI